MVTIEQIPADELVVMTEIWHRAFNAAGCNPMCHCCNSYIKAGDKFKLATAETYSTKTANSGISLNATQETREVMLCETCTVEALNKKGEEQLAMYEQYRNEGGGCYRINGKIIH